MGAKLTLSSTSREAVLPPLLSGTFGAAAAWEYCRLLEGKGFVERKKGWRKAPAVGNAAAAAWECCRLLEAEWLAARRKERLAGAPLLHWW